MATAVGSVGFVVGGGDSGATGMTGTATGAGVLGCAAAGGVGGGVCFGRATGFGFGCGRLGAASDLDGVVSRGAPTTLSGVTVDLGSSFGAPLGMDPGGIGGASCACAIVEAPSAMPSAPASRTRMPRAHHSTDSGSDRR